MSVYILVQMGDKMYGSLSVETVTDHYMGNKLEPILCYNFITELLCDCWTGTCK